MATQNDLVWPYEHWPAIRFNDGMNIGSRGGHGFVRYTIIDFREGEYIKFQFSKPDGFNGIHELKITALNSNTTEIRHEINAKLSFKAVLLWVYAVRWLHDALIEDAFDKVENHFLAEKKETTYNVWVKLLRKIYKSKSFQTKLA
ncbi:hypothetical protein [Winogradskyella pulchriflava]|uniref:Uncharacterized protein n=1 Tax=Winogradskyella pulchriflava TaxID=1110688 RepID=A0ABV6Q9A1_9FLAO